MYIPFPIHCLFFFFMPTHQSGQINAFTVDTHCSHLDSSLHGSICADKKKFLSPPPRVGAYIYKRVRSVWWVKKRRQEFYQEQARRLARSRSVEIGAIHSDAS